MAIRRTTAYFILTISLALFAAGCKKKVPPPPPPPPPAAKETPPPPPPPPAAPTISTFTAEPSTIERGQSASLRWSVANATEVKIEPGLGVVQANGNRTVFPSTTTQYELTATGPGGTRRMSASVNVTVPAPPPERPKPVERSASDRLAAEVQDVYYDYDKADTRDDSRATLTRNAEAIKNILQTFSTFSITVEGHCDERGSAEYNLGLGDRRATSAKDFLVQLGVPADRLKTISFGKERPQCSDQTEDCYQKNRRAHFTAGQ